MRIIGRSLVTLLIACNNSNDRDNSATSVAVSSEYESNFGQNFAIATTALERLAVNPSSHVGGEVALTYDGLVEEKDVTAYFCYSPNSSYAHGNVTINDKFIIDYSQNVIFVTMDSGKGRSFERVYQVANDEGKAIERIPPKSEHYGQCPVGTEMIKGYDCDDAPLVVGDCVPYYCLNIMPLKEFEQPILLFSEKIDELYKRAEKAVEEKN